MSQTRLVHPYATYVLILLVHVSFPRHIKNTGHFLQGIYRLREQNVYNRQVDQWKMINRFVFAFLSLCFSPHFFSLFTFPLKNKCFILNDLKRSIDQTEYPQRFSFLFPKISSWPFKNLIHTKPPVSLFFPLKSQHTRAEWEASSILINKYDLQNSAKYSQSFKQTLHFDFWEYQVWLSQPQRKEWCSIDYDPFSTVFYFNYN